jgi:hypothetical protein
MRTGGFWLLLSSVSRIESAQTLSPALLLGVETFVTPSPTHLARAMPSKTVLCSTPRALKTEQRQLCGALRSKTIEAAG